MRALGRSTMARFSRLAPLAAAPLAAALLISCAAAAADARAVVATVQALFDAIGTRDVGGAAKTLLPDGLFISVGGGGAPRITPTMLFLQQLAAGDSKLHEAFTETPEVRIDGDVATVWGRYEFTVDGKLSHTGIDALQLVRTAEGWRLTGGTYSVVRPAAPPSAPAR